MSAVGFPYFARFVPDGQAGRYAGVFFSARAIASTAALPAAGLLIAVTGSYRALLGMGALGLVAVLPLARAERRSAGAQSAVLGPPRPRARRSRGSCAVIPVFRSDELARAAETLQHVDELVLVDDGATPEVAAQVARRRGPARPRAPPGREPGQGHRPRGRLRAALRRAPDAIVALDSDGQHPPALIPDFVVAAGHADVVIGDRGRTRRMPSAPDRQRGVELGAQPRRPPADPRHAERDAALPDRRAAGGARPRRRFEAETRHLKALVRNGRAVGWVPMPTIYDGEPSSFRPVADTLRVTRAVLAPSAPAPPAAPASALDRGVAARVGAADRARHAPRLDGRRGAAAPGAADERLFRRDQRARRRPGVALPGARPAQPQLPAARRGGHAGAARRTRRLRFALGALLAMVLRRRLLRPRPRDRPARRRPPAARGGARRGGARSHGRHWSHIPSFPSGHLIVTAALVAAAATMAPACAPRFVYLAAVAITRVAFGAHFPLDVAVGAVIGWQVGLFSVALARAAKLLPAAPGERRSPPAATAVSPRPHDARRSSGSTRPADRDAERRAGEHVEPEVNAEIDAREADQRGRGQHGPA